MSEGDEQVAEVKGEDIDSGRVLALSDGVFAIAMTLLVLDVKVPEDVHGPEFLKALHDLLPALQGYLISYLVIGVLWRSHHRLFRRLTHITRPIMTVNLLLLGFIALLPFPSSLLARHGDEQLSYLLYAIDACAVFLLQLAIILIARYQDCLAPMTGRYQRIKLFFQPVSALFVFAVWVLLAYTLGANEPNWAWLLMIPVGFTARWLAKK